MQQSTFTIPDHIVEGILADGYTTDIVNDFTEYCQDASQTFTNYDQDDTPEHLWEAYEACMYPFKVFLSNGDVLVRFAQHSNDLERDVLPDCPGWIDYDNYPEYEHP